MKAEFQSRTEQPAATEKSMKQSGDKSYQDIIAYEWNRDSISGRMPLSKRAKIFLPFAALTGFEDALKETLRSEIALVNEGK